MVKNELSPKKQGDNIPQKDIKGLVAKYFPDCPELAWQIALKESNANPNQHNYNTKTKDDSWGLYQINLYGDLKKERPEPSQLVNAEFNIKYARMLYENSGFTFKKHWKTTSRKLGV